MVETKNSVYDEHNPPLVPATLADGPSIETRGYSGGTPTMANQTPSSRLQAVGSPRASSTESNNNDAQEQENKDPRTVASGVAGAAIGFLFGGPILAALFGFGSMYATQKPGATGDAARALGDVAITAKTKAEEIDRKHNVVDRSKKAAAEAWEQAKEYDRRHNVLDQAKEFAIFSWKSFSKFVQDHRLIERGVDGVGKGFEYVADRVISTDGDGNNTIPSASRT